MSLKTSVDLTQKLHLTSKSQVAVYTFLVPVQYYELKELNCLKQRRKEINMLQCFIQIDASLMKVSHGRCWDFLADQTQLNWVFMQQYFQMCLMEWNDTLFLHQEVKALPPV